MAAYNDNKAYIKLGGYSFAGKWQSVKITPKNSPETTTAGNVSHVQRNAGLDDYSYDLKIIADDGSALAAYIRKLKPGIKQELDCGWRGNTSGDPRMLQEVIVEEAPIETTSDKKPVVFEVKLSGSDVPILNQFDGAVY